MQLMRHENDFALPQRNKAALITIRARREPYRKEKQQIQESG
jgi:hypothetical protein